MNCSPRSLIGKAGFSRRWESELSRGRRWLGAAPANAGGNVPAADTPPERNVYRASRGIGLLSAGALRPSASRARCPLSWLESNRILARPSRSPLLYQSPGARPARAIVRRSSSQLCTVMVAGLAGASAERNGVRTSNARNIKRRIVRATGRVLQGTDRHPPVRPTAATHDRLRYQLAPGAPRRCSCLPNFGERLE